MRVMAVVLALVIVLPGCTTSPPSNTSDICAIFHEKDDWYEDAADARKEWNSPISVMMAIMHQESRFKATAKPPRKKILGFIPGFRPSNAYGYSQALDSTWDGYKRSAGRYGADRDDFGDAIDFIGWYNYQSHKRSGISRSNTYGLYLAYHDVHAPFDPKPELLKKYQSRRGVADAALAATVEAMEVIDECMARLVEVIDDLDGVLIYTADHGNADIMFTEHDGVRSPKTSHTLSPVPFAIHDPNYDGEYHMVGGGPSADHGLANVAATVFNLLGYEAPDGYLPSLIEF